VGLFVREATSILTSTPQPACGRSAAAGKLAFPTSEHQGYFGFLTGAIFDDNPGTSPLSLSLGSPLRPECGIWID